MNRDMDVVRGIVLGLRGATELFDHLDGINDDVFKYNAQLVIEAGLARGIVADSTSNIGGIPGAVFLGACRAFPPTPSGRLLRQLRQLNQTLIA